MDVLLIASDLAAAGQGKTYEMWVIPKGGAARPTGLFQSDSMPRAAYSKRTLGLRYVCSFGKLTDTNAVDRSAPRLRTKSESLSSGGVVNPPQDK